LKRDDLFTYVRPEAGAVVYCEYERSINSTELINRLRVEQSFLLTAGDQHGLDKGIRTGFGFGIEKTLKGLVRVEALMRSLKKPHQHMNCGRLNLANRYLRGVHPLLKRFLGGQE
jgi:hypothetical protein